jgi:hypothetical protein
MRKATRAVCTIGLALGKDVQTDYSVNATIDGKTYCFGNEAAKTEFMKDARVIWPKPRSITKRSTSQDSPLVEAWKVRSQSGRALVR